MLSNWGFVAIGFVFLAIFLCYRLINFLLKHFFQNYLLGKRLGPVLAVLELISWASVLFWIIYKLENGNPYLLVIISFILAVLIYYVFSYYFKDWIAGAILKYQNQLQPGDFVETSDVAGTVVTMKSKYIVVDDKQKQVFLPYSKLMEKVWCKRKNEDDQALLTFVVSVDKVKSVEKPEKQVLNRILALPWIDLDFEPQISLLQIKENEAKLEITVLALDKAFFPLIKGHFLEYSDEI